MNPISASALDVGSESSSVEKGCLSGEVLVPSGPCIVSVVVLLELGSLPMMLMLNGKVRERSSSAAPKSFPGGLLSAPHFVDHCRSLVSEVTLCGPKSAAMSISPEFSSIISAQGMSMPYSVVLYYKQRRSSCSKGTDRARLPCYWLYDWGLPVDLVSRSIIS